MTDALVLMELGQWTEKVTVPTAVRKELTFWPVVSLQVTGRPVLNFRQPYFVREQRTVRPLTIEMPWGYARRLYTFAFNHQVMGMEGHDSATFIRFLFGWGSSRGLEGRAHFLGDAISPQDVQPLRAYHMFIEEGMVARHDFLGLEKGLCLSVPNLNMGLIVARTVELMEAFGADSIAEIERIS